MKTGSDRRYFIALNPPLESVDEMCDVQEGIEDARWVEPEKIHLTLSFLGEIKDSAKKDIIHLVEHLHFPPFELCPQGLGFFPPRGRPHVLWLGVEKNEELMDLQQKLAFQLKQMKIGIESRKFIPHFTLARFDDVTPDEIQTHLNKYHLRKFTPFLVDEIFLYSSRFLKSGHTVYIRESE